MVARSPAHVIFVAQGSRVVSNRRKYLAIDEPRFSLRPLRVSSGSKGIADHRADFVKGTRARDRGDILSNLPEVIMKGTNSIVRSPITAVTTFN